MNGEIGRKEECESEVTFRRRFNPERRKPTTVGLEFPLCSKAAYSIITEGP